MSVKQFPSYSVRGFYRRPRTICSITAVGLSQVTLSYIVECSGL